MPDAEVARRHRDAAQAEFEPILTAMRRHFPDGNEDIVVHAYDVAQRTHAGQFRLSGDPFITHPIAVALILAEYGLDPETIAAALLHDTVEDTDLTLEDVEEAFGPNVARITDGVTKLDRVKFDISREEAQAATIRKMVVSMAQDVRVLIIKLVDRLHNLQTIHPLPVERQRVKARESLEIYAPLAHRMGFQEIKHEMEKPLLRHPVSGSLPGDRGADPAAGTRTGSGDREGHDGDRGHHGRGRAPNRSRGSAQAPLLDIPQDGRQPPVRSRRYTISSG